MSEHDIDLSRAVWCKASYSNPNGGNCVEVTSLDGGHRAVRDSKDPAGPVLTILPGEWVAFIISIRGDDFG